MNGTYINIYGLTFESALKIVTAFEEWEVIGKKHKIFHEGEVDLTLPQGHYRITCIEDYCCIEKLNKMIDETGKEKWKVENKLSFPRESFATMVIK